MTKPDWQAAATLAPEELASLLDADRDDVDDNPPTTDAQLATARPGRLRPGQRGPGKKQAKALLTIRVDPDALSAWRASGKGWQARINELLVAKAPRS